MSWPRNDEAPRAGGASGTAKDGNLSADDTAPREVKGTGGPFAELLALALMLAAGGGR